MMAQALPVKSVLHLRCLECSILTQKVKINLENKRARVMRHTGLVKIFVF